MNFEQKPVHVLCPLQVVHSCFQWWKNYFKNRSRNARVIDENNVVFVLVMEASVYLTGGMVVAIRSAWPMWIFRLCCHVLKPTAIRLLPDLSPTTTGSF